MGDWSECSFIAAATGLLIYNGMTKPHYSRADDTIVEEFKEWHVKMAANAMH